MKRNDKLSKGLNNLLGARDEAKERFGVDEAETAQQNEAVEEETPEEKEDIIDTIEDEELKELICECRNRKVGRPKIDPKDRVVDGEKYTRFTTIISRTQIAKLKEIAHRENLTLKAILEQVFGDAIAAYERKHGVVTPRSHKGDPRELFK